MIAQNRALRQDNAMSRLISGAVAGALVLLAASAGLSHSQPAAERLTMVKALTFDVFGTVVDWRSSIISEGRALSARFDAEVDWPRFADDWRGGYGPAMQRVRSGELPWTRIDDLHRMILDELIRSTAWSGSARRTGTISTVSGTGSSRGRTPCPG